MFSPRTETPAADKKSVLDGSVISLKLQPFALTAKNRHARRWCCLSTTRQSTPCASSVQCLSSKHRAVGWWLTAGTGAVASMRLQTERTDLIEIVPESSAARLCDFSSHVMVLVMHKSSSSSKYSTTAGNSGSPRRANFVDEFHLGASSCLLHPVLADPHEPLEGKTTCCTTELSTAGSGGWVWALCPWIWQLLAPLPCVKCRLRGFASNPQPPHRSGHGCTVGFNRDLPV